MPLKLFYDLGIFFKKKNYQMGEFYLGVSDKSNYNFINKGNKFLYDFDL